MSARKAFLLIFVLTAFCTINSNGQAKDTSNQITIPASDKYQRSDRFQKKWGKHYRQEWATPVKFYRVNLDTLAGGLKPYQAGGGRQSKSLRLRDKDDHEYVLRSIDKSFGKALPEIAQGTFIESIVNDQVTIAHPYSAITIAPMAEAAGIFHTNPIIFYVPKQEALGKFSDSMGNTLYLFEQRPDENWSTAPHFGNSSKIVSTEEMLEKIHKDNDNQVDQLAFVRSRLFDMFIGDWGRHEDQWRWAKIEDGKTTIYKPIPRDRDQAYTLFDGFLLKKIISFAGAKHLQNFDSTIKDVIKFNFPGRHMDFHLTNQVTVAQWVQIAKDLQMRLTDNIIDEAILQLPPEVYPISGPAIAAKLKSRRNHLDEYAREYATFLSEKVDITGTQDDEFFEIKGLDNNETEVNIYKITKEEKIKEKPFYHRVFSTTETNEIRLYGLDGKDQYKVSGNVGSLPAIRLIGGPGKDKYLNETGAGKQKTKVYDDRKGNDFRGNFRKYLINDSSVHLFDYSQFKYDKKGLRPIALYSFVDRIYVGLAYKYEKQGWRKKPFAQQHSIDVKYSLSQKAFSTTYKGTFTSVIGQWNLVPFLNYDQVQWNNYFGIGNETVFENAHANYNRLRTRRYYAELGIERLIKKYNKITFAPFFQGIKVINDSGRYFTKDPMSLSTETYNSKTFGGASLSYVFQKLNDSILPKKGISFIAWGSLISSLQNKSSFSKYGTELNGYIPLSNKFSLHVKAGGATFTGSPEFYYYNTIGGNPSLRGYERDRFYGRTSFYNQNTIRWITNFRTYVMNGTIGLFAFYDVGRVWMPNDKSSKWHPGYGPGLIFSPFNKIAVSAAFGISPEETKIHFDLIKVF